MTTFIYDTDEVTFILKSKVNCSSNIQSIINEASSIGHK